MKTNLIRWHYSPDGDPPSGGAPAADPESRARFSQRDVNEMIGREKAAAAARVEEQFKVKLDAIAKERDTFKSDYEKATSTLTELEPLKALAEEHKVLKGTMRATAIERALEKNGCNPSNSGDVRLLLEHRGVIKPDVDIATIEDWSPIVEKSKEIFPPAFATAETPQLPTGGTVTSGKPKGNEAPVDPVALMRERMMGKRK